MQKEKKERKERRRNRRHAEEHQDPVVENEDEYYMQIALKKYNELHPPITSVLTGSTTTAPAVPAATSAQNHTNAELQAKEGVASHTQEQQNRTDITTQIAIEEQELMKKHKELGLPINKYVLL